MVWPVANRNEIIISISLCTGPSSSGVKRRNASHNHSNAFDENLVVIYNRVPKTGSTSFINLAYDLCKKNQFFVLHINITANMHVLSLSNQVELIRALNHWVVVDSEVHSWLVSYVSGSICTQHHWMERHQAGIVSWPYGVSGFFEVSLAPRPLEAPKNDSVETKSIIFFRFSMPQKPIYINLIRKPLDRLVSYYYFLRNGDNYRPNLIRRKAGDKMVNLLNSVFSVLFG